MVVSSIGVFVYLLSCIFLKWYDHYKTIIVVLCVYREPVYIY